MNEGIFLNLGGKKMNEVCEARPMIGNEAIARGAWEARVKVAAAYPGTPLDGNPGIHGKLSLRGFARPVVDQ